MKEKRRSERINYLSTGWLQHKGTKSSCKLENISMHGAMVDLKKTPSGSIHHGEECCLKLSQSAEEAQYTDFMAKIVRIESAVVGLEFIEADGTLKNFLENIIRKEKHLFDGADVVINRAREVAIFRGIELTDIHFDNGKLIPEREIHTLRVFAGKHESKVHLHRKDIETFCGQDGTVPARKKIFGSIPQRKVGMT